MISIHEEIRGRMLEELDTKIRQQRGRDRQTITREVYKIASEELSIRDKMSRLVPWSGKWWSLLSQAEILRSDLIAGFAETDRFDPSISRGILFGVGGVGR